MSGILQKLFRYIHFEWRSSKAMVKTLCDHHLLNPIHHKSFDSVTIDSSPVYHIPIRWARCCGLISTHTTWSSLSWIIIRRQQYYIPSSCCSFILNLLSEKASGLVCCVKLVYNRGHFEVSDGGRFFKMTLCPTPTHLSKERLVSCGMYKGS